MLHRKSLTSLRIPFRVTRNKVQWRCFSTANQTIPLAYDLHLPASKEKYSPSQSIPPVILMHGVCYLTRQLTDLVAIRLKNITPNPFQKTCRNNSHASLHSRPPKPRRINKTGSSTSFLRTHGRGRRQIYPRS